MKTKTLILMCLAAALVFFAVGFIVIFSEITIVEDKVEQLKPKETKTIEDYHNLIEKSKEKIDEIAEDKWLKVSDIKEEFTLFCNGESYYIEVEGWQELLKKAEDAPQILWEPSPTNFSMVDVSIGVTAEQIVEAFKSIDPNSLIRHKKEKTTSDFTIIN